jgi:ABC-type branched-subunit amino acid transport system substrate-binding protein
VTRDDALVVGAILRGEATGEPNELERAAALAAEELDFARPFAVVACGASEDVLRGARHLVEDLRLSGIVGPTLGEHVVDVSQQASIKAGAAVMTPSALSSSITALADSDLTWRAVPSDGQRAKLVIDQIRALESLVQVTRGVTTVKLGIVHSDDAVGVGARDSIASKLVINGKFMSDPANASLVSIDAYGAGGDVSLQAAIATRYATAFKPDIVFVTAGEQVENVVVPLEQALTASRALQRPFYVITEAAKNRQLLDAIAEGRLPSDIRRRIRGIGTKSEAGSSMVASSFAARYSARYGAPPSTPAAAASYDAVYALAFAMAKGGASRGAGVAQALRSFAVGTPFAVGPDAASAVFDELAAGRAVSLRGTLGRLSWDSSGDLAAGLVEVWCVGGSGATATFGSSGLTMDVETQVVGGGFVQCQ